MKALKLLLPLIASSSAFLLIGCSTGGSQSGTPALFNTKAEAEKAAKQFNCIGAHQMGNKWMPCNNHKDHQKNKSQVNHGHHH